MLSFPIEFEFTEIHGYIVVVSYLHYFVPGSLKVHTKREETSLSEFTASFKVPMTRRWLPSGEAPYPGYCRAPGSSVCVPALCNCKQLKAIWKRIRHTQELLQKSSNGTGDRNLHYRGAVVTQPGSRMMVG